MIRLTAVLLAVLTLGGAGCRGTDRSYYEAVHLVDLETRRREEISRCMNSAAAGERPALEAAYDRQCERIERAIALRNDAERREFGDR